MLQSSWVCRFCSGLKKSWICGEPERTALVQTLCLSSEGSQRADICSSWCLLQRRMQGARDISEGGFCRRRGPAQSTWRNRRALGERALFSRLSCVLRLYCTLSARSPAARSVPEAGGGGDVWSRTPPVQMAVLTAQKTAPLCHPLPPGAFAIFFNQPLHSGWVAAVCTVLAGSVWLKRYASSTFKTL